MRTQQIPATANAANLRHLKAGLFLVDIILVLSIKPEPLLNPNYFPFLSEGKSIMILTFLNIVNFVT